MQRRNYDDVKRLYGDNAVLVRQWMTELTGDPAIRQAVPPANRRRGQPGESAAVHIRGLSGSGPVRLDLRAVQRLSTVDLGMGVTARMLSVVDDDLLVTWNSIQFAWGDR